jgi:Na+/proline symporter
MSSVASSMGAIASTVVADFYRPIRPNLSERHYVAVSRLAVLAAGLVLGLVAAACVEWQDRAPKQLLSFAIGVMLFAYTGLLGVFLTAVLTRRGNTVSVAAALLTGALAVALMQFGPVRIEQMVNGIAVQSRLSLGWQMFIGTSAAFVVCMLGGRRVRGAG